MIGFRKEKDRGHKNAKDMGRYSRALKKGKIGSPKQERYGKISKVGIPKKERLRKTVLPKGER